MSRNPAMFDQEKLDWLNGHYIREADTDRLAGLLGERLASLGVDTVADRLDALDDWSVESIHTALEALAEERGLSKTKAFQPIRAAVTFSNVSPPLFESLALLGRERTMDRLRSAAG